jgi:hypothetical protein
MHAVATESIARWAASSQVDASLLRAAFDEARLIDRRTVPISVPLKVEYLMHQKSLDDLPAAISQVATISPRVAPLLTPFAYAIGEPEMSHRASRLLWTNWLSQCDLPRPQRAPTIGVNELFRSAKNSTAVTAEELESIIQQSLLRKLSPPHFGGTIHAHDRERARQALLEVVLALQIHRRERGEFPEMLRSLVGRYLEQIPVDPFGKGEPVRYRRETPEKAAVWSIGPDGIDDSGQIELVKPDGRKADDLGILVNVRP